MEDNRYPRAPFRSKFCIHLSVSLFSGFCSPGVSKNGTCFAATSREGEIHDASDNRRDDDYSSIGPPMSRFLIRHNGNI